ncbi:protein of unknown function [Candidatus Hydrogenisulfobacillus filiaventi]|uniref:Uncharacterized protein n=1 Tax=Candidatus Hydrogenisulfobacillus filiaventi TaxID=2707344 RepID=A0A6F8ZIC6_9FIRM|nr:protein of unknown function [Candidatus Hydrogenisulfobacillus filiaventi]
MTRPRGTRWRPKGGLVDDPADLWGSVGLWTVLGLALLGLWLTLDTVSRAAAAARTAAIGMSTYGCWTPQVTTAVQRTLGPVVGGWSAVRIQASPTSAPGLVGTAGRPTPVTVTLTVPLPLSVAGWRLAVLPVTVTERGVTAHEVGQAVPDCVAP